MLIGGANAFVLLEQNGDAPQGAKTNQSEYDSCNDMSSTGENPGYNIKIEKSNASPIQAADDQNDECKSVKHFVTFNR